MNGDEIKKLMNRYGCGPVKLTGSDEALYERRLVFDHVIAPESAGAREQFEATRCSFAGRPVTALAEDFPNARRGKSQTGVLPVNGVSHWPVTLE